MFSGISWGKDRWFPVAGCILQHPFVQCHEGWCISSGHRLVLAVLQHIRRELLVDVVAPIAWAVT
jgi:hypothetical protein